MNVMNLELGIVVRKVIRLYEPSFNVLFGNACGNFLYVLKNFQIAKKTNFEKF